MIHSVDDKIFVVVCSAFTLLSILALRLQLSGWGNEMSWKTTFRRPSRYVVYLSSTSSELL